MSVFMTLRVKGDAKKLEALYANAPTTFSSVADAGKSMGAISHHFYATEDEILVVDEWPDEGAFHKFFDAQPEIPKIMAEAGVTTQPEVVFWRKLELGDDFG
jgi:heme-degrading monooxygenase HmoA